MSAIDYVAIARLARRAIDDELRGTASCAVVDTVDMVVRVWIGSYAATLGPILLEDDDALEANEDDLAAALQTRGLDLEFYEGDVYAILTAELIPLVPRGWAIVDAGTDDEIRCCRECGEGWPAGWVHATRDNIDGQGLCNHCYNQFYDAGADAEPLPVGWGEL